MRELTGSIFRGSGIGEARLRQDGHIDWRVIVVGGHTRSIGKTQLVCDLIAAIPEAGWVAGKITQYGHGVCAKNGKDCDCAPDEHVCALSWEERPDTKTDSGRFLAAGAHKSFWLRTKQGFLAEGMPLLREALSEVDAGKGGQSRNLILESNTLLQFWKPALYLMVLNPANPDFKESARLHLDKASALVLRAAMPEPKVASEGAWAGVPLQLLRGKRRFVQGEGETLPSELTDLVRSALGPDAASLNQQRSRKFRAS
jgi:hypothetical protein